MKIALDNIDFGYLNLPQRHDRKSHIEGQFERHGIEARCVDGWLCTKENYTPDDTTMQMYNRTPGAIACWSGQVKIIETADPSKIAGVFEDDCTICEDFPERIEYLGEHVPSDWNVVWLGATFHCNPAVWHKDTLSKDAERVGHRIFRTYGIWSTFAYLVNPTSRAHVLDLLACNKYRSDGIDDCFIKWLEKDLRTYCMVPGCCWQMDSRSNIGNGVTQFSLFKKHLGGYAWQQRMELFNPDDWDWGEAGYQ